MERASLKDAPGDVLMRVISRLRLLCQAELSAGNSEGAERYRAAMGFAQHELDGRCVAERREPVAFEARIEYAVGDVSAQQERWQECRGMMEARLQAQVAELRRRHEAELSGLRNRWFGPVQTRRYNRPSSHLGELRKRVGDLMVLSDFDGARNAASAAAELEAWETASRQAQREGEYVAALRLLVARHEREVKDLAEQQEQLRREFEAVRQGDLETAQRRVENLRREKATTEAVDRVWVRRTRRQSPLPKALPPPSPADFQVFSGFLSDRLDARRAALKSSDLVRRLLAGEGL